MGVFGSILKKKHIPFASRFSGSTKSNILQATIMTSNPHLESLAPMQSNQGYFVESNQEEEDQYSDNLKRQVIIEEGVLDHKDDNFE